jgi:hypothetical protein
MKINPRILHIPPYLSTTWNHIQFLRMSGELLVVHLINDDVVAIPNLDRETIDVIFTCHALSVEIQERSTSGSRGGMILPPQRPDGEFPFRLGFGATDGLGMAVQHNPAQANGPDLPSEVLDKISAIAKIVAPDDPQLLPTPEPNCNCMFCQFARAINPAGAGNKNISDENEKQEEELVSDEELHFQQWQIIQRAEAHFTVKNKLDNQESYEVHLGDAVHCTCGRQGCEHIIAVLKS